MEKCSSSRYQSFAALVSPEISADLPAQNDDLAFEIGVFTFSNIFVKLSYAVLGSFSKVKDSQPINQLDLYENLLVFCYNF